jgi:hypothetical protein
LIRSIQAKPLKALAKARYEDHIRPVVRAGQRLRAAARELDQVRFELKQAITVVRKVGGRRSAEFRMTEYEGLVERECMDKPATASIDLELEWVGSNLHLESPGFAGCPSINAANMWVALRSDQLLARKFWEMQWAVRRPDRGGKRKESPLEADAKPEDDSDARAAARKEAAELERRLFPKRYKVVGGVDEAAADSE